jgi:hypothetical protein
MTQKLLMAWLLGGMAMGQAPASKDPVVKDNGPGPLPSFFVAPSGKPLPKLPNGKPDLSGMWSGASLNANRAKLEAPPYKPEFIAKVRELAKDNSADPGVNCFLLGTPRVTSYPFPFKIVQSPKETIILYEAMRTFRDIPTDGRNHSLDPDNTFMGESIGHWEGDTLVVDTVGFNDKTWLIGRGTFHSEDLHVVERYSATADGRIRYEAVAEDPKVFTRPWKAFDGMLNVAAGPDTISEYECIEGNRDREHLIKQE